MAVGRVDGHPIAAPAGIAGDLLSRHGNEPSCFARPRRSADAPPRQPARLPTRIGSHRHLRIQQRRDQPAAEGRWVVRVTAGKSWLNRASVLMVKRLFGYGFSIKLDRDGSMPVRLAELRSLSTRDLTWIKAMAARRVLSVLRNPVIATDCAAAMSLSSVSVVGNSLRLRKLEIWRQPRRSSHSERSGRNATRSVTTTMASTNGNAARATLMIGVPASGHDEQIEPHRRRDESEAQRRHHEHAEMHRIHPDSLRHREQ